MCQGQGVECHSQGNPGGGLGQQEKQGAIVGEGKRRKGRPPQEFLSLHMCGLLEGKAMDREAPLGPMKSPLTPATGGHNSCSS